MHFIVFYHFFSFAFKLNTQFWAKYMYMRNVIVEDVEIHPYPSIPPFCVEQPIIAHFLFWWYDICYLSWNESTRNIGACVLTVSEALYSHTFYKVCTWPTTSPVIRLHYAISSHRWLTIFARFPPDFTIGLK